MLTGSHPILKSYLETVFVRLKKENKVLKSKDGKYIIFNTNLLNKFFQDIYIIAEVHAAEDIEVYMKPIRTSKESYAELRRYGFEGMVPEPPKFFDDVNEVTNARMYMKYRERRPYIRWQGKQTRCPSFLLQE